MTSKAKNWFVDPAQKSHRRRVSKALRVEARRQSLLASGMRWKDERHWEMAAREVWDDLAVDRLLTRAAVKDQ